MICDRASRWQRLLQPMVLASGVLAISIATMPAAVAEPVHGLSIFGDLKYGPDFEHFDYASPEAIKGGSVTLGALGSFDNLNPFILKGRAAAGASLVYDTLTAPAQDEASAVYGLLAESMEVAEDGGSVTFYLRPEARWHDGEPLTAADVVWTFTTLKTDGHPLYRQYYAAVTSATAIDDHTVRFDFSQNDNVELPFIVGQLAIMPEHFWADRDFTDTTLEPLLGSGPYRFGKIDAGRSVTFERVEDYWGAELPVRVGHNNFDKLRYDYYRDQTIIHEALKSGNIDFKREYTSKTWATGYDFPAMRDGRVVMEEIPDGHIQPMQAFIFNTRLDKFSDPRVREAIGYAFDFEWLNENLFYGAYERVKSFFQNSELAATGLPEGDELALLEPFRDQLPARVFDTEFTLPETDGSGNLRAQYRAALALLKDAGWQVKNGKLTHLDSGEVMNIELVVRQPNLEKLGLAYRKTLQRLGIDLKVRVIDTAQYEKRMEDFDFEMTTIIVAQTLSPGNEQWDYWGSGAAETPGSRNRAGIANSVIDALITRLVAADSRESLVTATRALDRVLLHSHYMIPQYFGATYRVAYWNKFVHPEVGPDKELGFTTWWIDPQKAAALLQ